MGELKDLIPLVHSELVRHDERAGAMMEKLREALDLECRVTPPIMAAWPTTLPSLTAKNVYLGFRKRLGWQLDWKRFRIHLKDTYGVARAYYFIGYLPENQSLYRSLQIAGYTVIFKPVTYDRGGKPKGNVDAELVLQAMIDLNEYEKAVIVTSDGDFQCLVRYLSEKGKMERVLSPNRAECSALLKKAAGPKIDFLEDARRKLEYKKGTP